MQSKPNSKLDLFKTLNTNESKLFYMKNKFFNPQLHILLQKHMSHRMTNFLNFLRTHIPCNKCMSDKRY